MLHFCNRKFFSKSFLALFFCTILIFSSSHINDSFTNKANAQTCTSNLPTSSATASGFDTGKPPSNAIDNNFGTRWANPLIGSWIGVDLGSTKSICSVDIAWYNGNQRQYHFVIATSTDGTTFTNKFSGDSSGTTLNSEKYTFASTNARYVRVTVNSNTQNSYATLYELDVFGPSVGSLSFISNLTYPGYVS